MIRRYISSLPDHVQTFMSRPRTYDPVKQGKPRYERIGRVYFFSKTVFACFLYYFDIVSDLYLLWKYYESEQLLYFGLTFGFIILSMLFVKFGLFLTGFLFLCQFICCRNKYSSNDDDDDDEEGGGGEENGCCKCNCDLRARFGCCCSLTEFKKSLRSCCTLICCITLIVIMCLVQMHMVIMYIVYILLEIFSKPDADGEKKECVLLRKIMLIVKMIEMHFESIPQYSLQLYLFFDHLNKTRRWENAQVPIIHIFSNHTTRAALANWPITDDQTAYLTTTLATTLTTSLVNKPPVYGPQIQVWQLISVGISAFSISLGSATYYFDAFSFRIKLFKFVSFFIQFTARFMLYVLFFRTWGWPVLVIGCVQLLIDFLHIFKYRGDQLLKFPFLSFFNLLTLCFHTKIMHNEKHFRKLSILLFIVYFLENMGLVLLFHFCFKEFNPEVLLAFTIAFAVGFLVAIVFELLALFNIGCLCLKLLKCSCCP